ncbi:MAG: RsmE family RNA methyltransferase, partial [Halanaerobium sp.]|nr:RsmE family RNA methyltransferase [Halanaerobium sp.]
ELVIQKGVELGVDQVIPFSAERSVVKLTPAKAQRRSERWQRIAMEAAKQSGRGRLTSVAVPMAFSDSVEKAVKESDWIIVPYEEEEITYLKEYLTRIELSLGDEAQTIKGEYPVISVFIGPEGGFSPREIVLLQDAGGQSVSIGPRILRTETAGIAVLTMILYHLGDLGEVK